MVGKFNPFWLKSMNIITHALVGWCAGMQYSNNSKEVLAVTVASTIPDIDAFGALIDLYRGGEAILFSEYHHKFGHCLPFCLLMMLIIYLGSRKFRLALICGGIFHLHLICDIIGARGPDGYQWPIYYFYPFSDYGFTWAGQWPVNGWQNIVLTIGLLVVFLFQSAAAGFSPLRFLSTKADEAFVRTLQIRFAYKRISDGEDDSEE